MNDAAQKSTGAQTRHAEILTCLRERIEAGIYPLGGLLPPEQVLRKELSVSRFTLRQALAGLRALGLIEARAGFGTYVTRVQPRETIVHRMNGFEELLRYPAETRRQQLSVAPVTINKQLERRLKLAIGTHWVNLKAMRIAGGADGAIAPDPGPAISISWLDAYIAPQFGDVLDLPNPDNASLLSQIERHNGLSAARAEVDIFVGTIDGEATAPLQCQPGDPALIILRRYRDFEGDIYLVTYSIHPENRFSLSFDLSRQSATDL